MTTAEDYGHFLTMLASGGTYPWIDRRNDLYGVFFMRRRLPFVEQEVQAARRIITQAAENP